MKPQKPRVDTFTEPLEKALFSIASGNRNSAIVARHYGFDGLGGANFQVIGKEFGLSRERVRQIVSESDPYDQLALKGSPFLDRVIAFIAAGLPAPTAVVEARLQVEGLTATQFHIEGIVKVADLLGRSVPFRIGSLNHQKLVLPLSCPHFSDIVSRARQRVRRHGMATIREFVDNALSGKEARANASLIEAVLVSQPGFRWLDHRLGWFWLTGIPRNRAVTQIRKMLAVANPLTGEELRAGLFRNDSWVVPKSILLAFCSQTEGLSVRENIIHASPRLEIDAILNKTGRDIYMLLSRNSGYMSNKELIKHYKHLGIRRPTFYQCVSCSPIVVRVKRSHYRLIGSCA